MELPRTPPRGDVANERINLKEVLLRLDATYNIGLHRYLETSRQLRSSHDADEFRRAEDIIRRLRYHVQSREGQIHDVLKDFDVRVGLISSGWVHKPLADRGTTPTRLNPPRALNADERRDLQNALLYVLESRSPKKPASFRLDSGSPVNVNATSFGESFEVESPQRHRSAKRSSGGFEGGPSKRNRPTRSFPATSLDEVPVREKPQPIAAWRESLDRAETPRDSEITSTAACDSRNTSKASLISRVFETPPLAPSDSQTTYAVSSQETTEAIPKIFAHRPAFGRANGQSLAPPAEALHLEPSEHVKLKWPALPKCLQSAPFHVIWEVTRIALHCRVNLADFTPTGNDYECQWNQYGFITRWLARNDLFRGKSFPVNNTSQEAWKAATNQFRSGQYEVVFSASVGDSNFDPKTDPVPLTLHPIRLDFGHRLSRKYGPDRFMEILIPSQSRDSSSAGGSGSAAIRAIYQQPHEFLGRQWSAFYIRDAGHRKPVKDVKLEKDTETRYQERLYMFAEDGIGFERGKRRRSSQRIARGMAHVPVTVASMLDWLLHLRSDKNRKTPFTKLFSRIQLGLSRTIPTIVLERHQIIFQKDLRSPTGEVMNDGIGRISRSLLRKVHSRLDQGSDYPLCGFQGRIGSAKGFWILDVDEDDNGDDWIELYESQRKWECDLEDPLHRTIEVRNTPHKLKSALLNLQFLPILYDRARDKAAFREYMKILLTKNLESELDVHMTAMDSAEQLRQWASTFGFRQDLAASMLGGLPDSDEDTLAFLLDAGVDKDYQLIKDISWRLRKSKCDTLLSTLKIRVPRSAYMYMTVDFQGVLEEDEVHIGFSSRFVTEDAEFSAKLLRGIDVLVARAPAHLPSDVQRVRAVFKTELNDLEDVIVFSSKGSVPLASKLSGGDYDGDQAWVCWDPEIVQNFDNFPMPTMPDLFKEGYMRKETRKFCDLQASGTGSFDGVESLDEVCRTWISESIQFNLQPNFLGMATNYKERFCYAHGHNSVSGPAAIKLSTLLSNLVDQPKQGILFSEADFSRLKAGIGARTWYHDPAYKGDKWTRPDTEPDHIIDYIKFKVAKPMIESVLKRFHEYMNEGSKTGAPSRLYWDQDLAALYDTFKAISKQSKSVEKLAQRLEHDLERVFMLWNAKMQPVKDGMARRSPSEYQQAVWDVFNEWWAVVPRNEGAGFKTAALLLLPTVVAAALPHHSVDVGDGPPSPYSTWALLRASATFKLFYARNPRFVWRIAGMQLLYLKAQAQVGHAMAMGAGAQGESGPAAAAAIVPVVPRMYSILRPDARAVRRLVSERDGRVSVFDDEAGVVAVAYQQAGRPEQLQRQIADGVTSIGAAAGFDGASDDGTAASEYLDYYDAYSVILMDDDAVYDDVD